MSKTFLFPAIQFSQTFLLQTIQFSIQKQFHFKQFSLAEIHSLNVKTVLFKRIQFSISTQFSSIWPMDRTLSDATTPGQSEPGSDNNDGVLHIPQSSSIIGASTSDCFVSYQGHLLVGGLTTLQRSSRYILQPLMTGKSSCYCPINGSTRPV